MVLTAIGLGRIGGAGEHALELLGHPRSRPPPHPPARANRSRCGRITASSRSPLVKRITGMSLGAANPSTALRKRSPIFSSIAGDGIGNPTWEVSKPSTWPDTCRLGTR